MIKIIKNGDIPKKYKTIYKTECENCGCEFEFELEDCSRVARNGEIVIECPCCKKELEKIRGWLKARMEEVTDEENITNN